MCMQAKRYTLFTKKDHQYIAKYTAQFGTTAATIKKFKHRFPNLMKAPSKISLSVQRKCKSKKESKKLPDV